MTKFSCKNGTTSKCWYHDQRGEHYGLRETEVNIKTCADNSVLIEVKPCWCANNDKCVYDYTILIMLLQNVNVHIISYKLKSSIGH